jgi:hypothetical protein
MAMNWQRRQATQSPVYFEMLLVLELSFIQLKECINYYGIN